MLTVRQTKTRGVGMCSAPTRFIQSPVGSHPDLGWTGKVDIIVTMTRMEMGMLRHQDTHQGKQHHRWNMHHVVHAVGILQGGTPDTNPRRHQHCPTSFGKHITQHRNIQILEKVKGISSQESEVQTVSYIGRRALRGQAIIYHKQLLESQASPSHSSTYDLLDVLLFHYFGTTGNCPGILNHHSCR